MEKLKTLEGAKMFLNNIPQECRKNLITVIESNAQEEKQNKLLSIQQEIFSKPNMQDNHRYVLTKITNNLVENNHQAELEQLNKGIDFTEKGGLIVHTSLGDIKFSPKQATFDDIKDINGIEEGKNVFTENEATEFKGLRISNDEDTIDMIKSTGKKIFSPEDYSAIIERVFSGLNHLYKCNKVFFDILGANQYGRFDNKHKKRLDHMDRFLCADTGEVIVSDNKYHNGIIEDECYSGIRFIED